MVKKDTEKKDSTKEKESVDSSKTNNFITETTDELAKVVWPSRQQLISESVAVILMVSLVATLIYFVNQLFSFLASQPFLFGS